MRIIAHCTALRQGLDRIIKKGFALVLFHTALFLNTRSGKWCACSLLLFVMTASVVWAHIILYPLLITAFGALWRRLIFYVIVRRLSARKRRWIRREWADICKYAQLKWKARSFFERLALKLFIGVVIGMTLLHYLHIWSVAAYITAILPIPVFLEIYLGQKLPRIIAGFVQRQGIGKLVFDGGWKLVPVHMRFGLRSIDRSVTGLISRTNKRSVDRAFARLEHIKELRQKRIEEYQLVNKYLERELAALD